jgi:phosphoserine/homoserine phosphotransferase
MICLDLEGVLVPEIWINFAKRTGIEALKATTRDEPDYNILMKNRLKILDQHGLKLKDIQAVIAEMGPMEGARDFLDALRQDFQVVILSDTFYEFAQPLMKQLGWPTLFCHRLTVDPQGRVSDYVLRMTDHKRQAVIAFKNLKFQVLSAGDSYNDTSMLGESHAGFLFRAPANVIQDFPQFPLIDEFGALEAAFRGAARQEF